MDSGSEDPNSKTAGAGADGTVFQWQMLISSRWQLASICILLLLLPRLLLSLPAQPKQTQEP